MFELPGTEIAKLGERLVEGVPGFAATILHCLGVDHLKLTYKYQGRLWLS